jgi:hypothetical protein
METITLPARVRPLSDSDVTDGLVGHESRHGAVASLLGFDVSSIRCDWPEPHVAGRVSFDHSAEVWDDARLGEYFIVIASGPMGEPGWPPPWPPSLSNPGSDEYALARIAELIHLNEGQYSALCDVARKTIQEPAVKAVEGVFSTFLRHANLGRREVRELARAAFKSHFKEVHEQHEREAQQLEALTEQPPADDEAPAEREALHRRHQATLERSLANLRVAIQHDSDRAPGAKAPRIASGFWRGVL